MDKNRRNFLKVAGISTLAGLGAPAIVDRVISGKAGADVFASGGNGGHHEAEAPTHNEPAHKEEKSGTRYGLVIDTRKFHANPELGEKCVHACNQMHNIPQFPEGSKNEIKWIWLTNYENAFPEHSQQFRDKYTEDNKVLVTCNHCENPPCVRACPTKATYKSKDGITMMDFHRCIGCRFCMAACPYGARSFNWLEPKTVLPNPTNPDYPRRMRGVVEKCNFCSDRLVLGEQPACVAATGNSGAMIFGNLNDPNSEIRKVLKENFTIQRKPSLGTNPSVFYIV
ncbi:MAG: 4Fe-4S dicluster domain-containing protein [Desulfobulbaceae bacterium]|nr:4Fe-4S dicluster domain-containing protein [Desulfobulbaceae bacterium]